jgi:hypothetical protein
MLPLVLSPLVLSSDTHVFEPPDLWQTRIDAAFRDRAPQIERIDGADQIVATARRFTGSRACPRGGGGRHAPERLLPPQRGTRSASPAARLKPSVDCRVPT